MQLAIETRGQENHCGDEVEPLRRVLDRSYALIRERAQSEWEKRAPRNNPADACVSIRIASGDCLPA